MNCPVVCCSTKNRQTGSGRYKLIAKSGGVDIEPEYLVPDSHSQSVGLGGKSTADYRF